MKRILRLALFFILTGLSAFTGLAQETAAQETESTVPDLIAFHDIIYPIWHTAYPEKDYAALRSYAPEVKRLAEKVYAAELPPILHEKEVKWQQALAEFKKAVDDYLGTASGSNDEAMLNAAEALHARYEMMVRTIRPVLKEVDEFHKVLYVVYHKYLPNKDYDKIDAASAELMLKAEAITRAVLPRRLESRKDAFQLAATGLYEETKALAETSKSGEGKAIETAVEKVHSAYQNLEKIFD